MKMIDLKVKMDKSSLVNKIFVFSAYCLPSVFANFSLNLPTEVHFYESCPSLLSLFPKSSTCTFNENRSLHAILDLDNLSRCI